MSEEIRVSVTVNGRAYERLVEPRRSLADFLRHDLLLHGTHVGCEMGACGACTVLFDGQAIKSCLMLAVQAQGHEIITVESLAGRGPLHALQRAFRDCHALQCGFCTPGFLMVALALERSHRKVDQEALKEELAGNICRCTGYRGIVNAVSRFLEESDERSADA